MISNFLFHVLLAILTISYKTFFIASEWLFCIQLSKSKIVCVPFLLYWMNPAPALMNPALLAMIIKIFIKEYIFSLQLQYISKIGREIGNKTVDCTTIYE